MLGRILSTGHCKTGKPERLTGDLSSYWSRRIDDCNRLVYRIDGDVIGNQENPDSGLITTQIP